MIIRGKRGEGASEREELVKTVISRRLSETRLNCSRKLLDIISSTCETGAGGFKAEFTFFFFVFSLFLFLLFGASANHSWHVQSCSELQIWAVLSNEVMCAGSWINASRCLRLLCPSEIYEWTGNKCCWDLDLCVIMHRTAEKIVQCKCKSV